MASSRRCATFLYDRLVAEGESAIPALPKEDVEELEAKWAQVAVAFNEEYLRRLV